jgi:O-antigen ligase
MRRSLAINLSMIGMTLWLLYLSNSATSRVCLALGCIIVMLSNFKPLKKNPARVAAAVAVFLCAYLVLDFFFDVSSIIAGLVGRDATFTGRTGMWEVLLAAQTNPLVGVGYQSFWLGHRLTGVLGALNTTFLNQAHNGYLETYLNLGIIGLALIASIMISSYRTIWKRLTVQPLFAPLSLALWAVMVIYNVTEAAFGASFLWCLFLLCTVVVSRGEGEITPYPVQSVTTPRTTAGRRSPVSR